MSIKQQRLFILWVMLAMFGLMAWAQGANKYLREGASGAANGNDWTDAYTSLTTLESNLARGDTGYVADGTYGGVTFNTAVSGTTVITLKKATVADHGTSTGWLDSYGDGIAYIDDIDIQVSDITIDGAYKYGFEMITADGGGCIFMSYVDTAARANITIRYVNMHGDEADGYAWLTDTRCIYAAPHNGSVGSHLTNLVVENCNMHAVSTAVQIEQISNANLNNIIFQSNIIHGLNGIGGAGAHANDLYMTSTKRVIFRYNSVSNTASVGFYPSYSGGYYEIYGNTWSNADQCISAFATGSYPDTKIYNNTFYDCYYGVLDYSAGSLTGSVSNNIFYSLGGGNSYPGMDKDYNWHTGTTSEPNGVDGGAVNPFSSGFTIATNIAADYPRNKGIALSSTYQTDVAGNTRGADGTWDMGAFEYASGGGESQVWPTNVVVTETLIIR